MSERLNQPPEINPVIKDYVQKGGPEGWKHQDTLEWAYGIYDLTRFMWFSPKDETQLALPQAALGIGPLGVRTLAAYRLTYNPNGIPFEITLGEEHIDRSPWELAESLVHETIHLHLDYLTKKKRATELQTCGNLYHGKSFCEIAESIGLHPVPGVGCHYKPADGQFQELFGKWLGLTPPEPPDGQEWPLNPPKGTKTDYWTPSKPRGKSSLVLYMADECTEAQKCKLRAGKVTLDINCGKCGGHFEPHLNF